MCPEIHGQNLDQLMTLDNMMLDSVKEMQSIKHYYKGLILSTPGNW